MYANQSSDTFFLSNKLCYLLGKLFPIGRSLSSLQAVSFPLTYYRILGASVLHKVETQ